MEKTREFQDGLQAFVCDEPATRNPFDFMFQPLKARAWALGWLSGWFRE